LADFYFGCDGEGRKEREGSIVGRVRERGSNKKNFLR
jgi:hypothetical protein